MAQRQSPEPLIVRMRVDGVAETLKAFRDLPKEASAELRQAALGLSRDLALKVQAAGLSEGRQASELAGTVKAKFDRTPSITVGGTKALGRNRTPAWRLLIGSEFGMEGQGGKGAGTRNFAPHGFAHRQSPQGIWIFPTVRAAEGEIAAGWSAAADEIVRKFTEGGEA